MAIACPVALFPGPVTRARGGDQHDPDRIAFGYPCRRVLPLLPRGVPRLSQQEPTAVQTAVPEGNGGPSAPQGDGPVASVASNDVSDTAPEIDQDAPVVLDDL